MSRHMQDLYNYNFCYWEIIKNELHYQQKRKQFNLSKQNKLKNKWIHLLSWHPFPGIPQIFMKIIVTVVFDTNEMLINK